MPDTTTNATIIITALDEWLKTLNEAPAAPVLSEYRVALIERARDALKAFPTVHTIKTWHVSRSFIHDDEYQIGFVVDSKEEAKAWATWLADRYVGVQ